eukprot:Rmarinus@m.7519
MEDEAFPLDEEFVANIISEHAQYFQPNDDSSVLEQYYEQIMAFSSAVRWTEPFMLCLGVFHLTLLFLVLWTRHNLNLQFVLMSFMLAICLSSENLNDFLHENWQSVATQDYFDQNGFFSVNGWACPHSDDGHSDADQLACQPSDDDCHNQARATP